MELAVAAVTVMEVDKITMEQEVLMEEQVVVKEPKDKAVVEVAVETIVHQ